MSNKIVVDVYNTIIQDVVNSVRDRFEEEGLDDDGAQQLKDVWEANLKATRVAPFDPDFIGTDPTLPLDYPVEDPIGYAGEMPYGQPMGAYGDAGAGMYQGGLRGGAPETMRIRGGASSEEEEDEEEDYEDEEDVKPFLADDGSAQGVNPDQQIFKQYAGFAKGEDDEDDGAGSSRKPRDNKGAIKRDPGVQPNENGIYPGEEIIDSDLDDSEEEDEFAGAEDEDEDPDDDLTKDVMYCICDKVARVKNKWKVTFRDGFIRANGKEYLFNRCTGEFEW